MGFNIRDLGAVFRGQQEYEEYQQAKQIRAMQLAQMQQMQAQMQMQNDPRLMSQSWDTALNAKPLNAQPEPAPAPPPGQASMPAQPAPPMPQAGPQQGVPMQQQGMPPQGVMPPPQGQPAPPLPPYKALNGGPNMRGAVPGDDMGPSQGGGPAPAMPKPEQQASAQAGPAGAMGPQAGSPSGAPAGPPVQLKQNMSLNDLQRFIQQNYANDTAAEKFTVLEKAHGLLSADAKIELQQKTLEMKEKVNDALIKLHEEQESRKKEKSKHEEELLDLKGILAKAEAKWKDAQSTAKPDETKAKLITADAATTKAGAAVTSANASASRAATAAAGGGSDGTDKLTPEGRAVRDSRAMAGLPTYKAKRGQIDYDLYNSLGKKEGADIDAVVKPAEYKANAASLAATQKRADAIDLGSRKIPLDINTMLGTLDKGAAGGWQLTNEPINALRKKFSDPDLRKFALAVKQVGTEYERLLTGGMLSAAQLHAGAAEDAKKLLNEDMSPAEIKAVIPIMLQEIKNAKTASNDELKEIKNRMRGKNAEEKSEPAQETKIINGVKYHSLGGGKWAHE